MAGPEVRLCACRSPQRSIVERDRLRCSSCSQWTPAGRPSSRETVARAAEEALSLLTQSLRDYAWLVGVLYGLQRRGGGAGRLSGVADPTGAMAASEPHVQARAFAALASRFLERALADLALADEAIGDALLAVDPGPRVKVDYANVDVVPEGREDLKEAHRYRAQRRARGEAVPG